MWLRLLIFGISLWLCVSCLIYEYLPTYFVPKVGKVGYYCRSYREVASVGDGGCSKYIKSGSRKYMNRLTDVQFMFMLMLMFLFRNIHACYTYLTAPSMLRNASTKASCQAQGYQH